MNVGQIIALIAFALFQPHIKQWHRRGHNTKINQ